MTDRELNRQLKSYYRGLCEETVEEQPKADLTWRTSGIALTAVAAAALTNIIPASSPAMEKFRCFGNPDSIAAALDQDETAKEFKTSGADTDTWIA